MKSAELLKTINELKELNIDIDHGLQYLNLAIERFIDYKKMKNINTKINNGVCIKNICRECLMCSDDKCLLIDDTKYQELQPGNGEKGRITYINNKFKRVIELLSKLAEYKNKHEIESLCKELKNEE